MPADVPVVVVVAGPTASGKTAAALEVAEAWGATIVSADAMQVYRGMDIGTAKATEAERARVPHEGIDRVDPHEDFDADAWVALADAVIARGGPVVVAGGTGFYLRALQRGLVHTPPVDPELRAELDGIEDLHGTLTGVDPALAARLHPNDRVRLVRGLEVFRQTGERLSALQEAHAAGPDRVRFEGVCLDRADLDARIDARVLAMMEAGYLDEVRGLLRRGVTRDLKPMRSLGYRHLADHLLDAVPLDEAVRRTQRDTRRFARKQRTWMNTLVLPTVDDHHVDAVFACAARAFGARSD